MRLEFKSFITDVLDGVFQLKHGLFHTFVELRVPRCFLSAVKTADANKCGGSGGYQEF